MLAQYPVIHMANCALFGEKIVHIYRAGFGFLRSATRIK